MARADVPTCRLDESLGAVAKRVEAAGWDVCVVVNEQRIVLGLLRAGELQRDPTLAIEGAMRPGPSTFRPYRSVAELGQYMSERNLDSSPITTSDGRLVGLLRRQDATEATGQHEGRDD